MTPLEQLQQANPHLQIQSVQEAAFADYGRVIALPHQAELMQRLTDQTSIPAQGNQYVRDAPSILEKSAKYDIARQFYGEQPIEVGYCNGHSDRINAFEWHNCSELNLAVTDLVLFLARRQDLTGQTIDTSRARAFFVPRGTAIEVYPTTLHFAPCQIDAQGFKCIVILTDQTNTPLAIEHQADEALFQYNKWLITHAENDRMVHNGALIGVTGTNQVLTPMTKERVLNE